MSELAVSLLRAASVEDTWQTLEQRARQRIDAYRGQPGGPQQEAWGQFVQDCARLPEEHLQRWLQEDPQSGLAYLALGVQHSDMASNARGAGLAGDVSSEQWQAVDHHFGLARGHLLSAIELGVPAGLPLNMLMQREQIRGSRTAGERYFRQMLDGDPQWLDGWLRIQGIREPRWGGSLSDMEALLVQAREVLKDAAQLARLEGTHYWWLGSYAYHFDDDPEQALQHLQCALEKSDHPQLLASIHEYRAYCLKQLEHPEEAILAWRAALACLPESSEYRFRLALALDEQGRPSDALEHAESGSDGEGEYAYWSSRLLGMIWLDGEGDLRVDAERALAWFRKAQTQADDAEKGAEMTLRIADILRSRGDVTEAADAYRQAADMGSASAPRCLADLLRQQGGAERHAEIVDLYRLASERGDGEAAKAWLDYLRGYPQCDPTELDACLEQAAQNGDADAARMLARHSWERNEPLQAELWLAQAALKSSDCAYALGRGLSEGWFGQVEHHQAYQLFDAMLNRVFHADASLSYCVALHEMGKENWETVKFLKREIDRLDNWVRQGEISVDERFIGELHGFRQQLPRFWFGWRLRKLFGRLPVLKRSSEIPGLWD
ncbi:Tetratricopeptide repeat protein [compost metagenome]